MNVMYSKKNKLLVSGCLIFVVLLVWGITSALASPSSATEIVEISMDRIDKTIQEAIENKELLAFSSNPYDYIADNEDYDKMVSLGVEALPELERLLAESENNGLNEFIIAIAIEDITNADVKEILDDEFAWENAKEFYENWSDIKLSADDNIEQIVASNDLTKAQKSQKISAYGVLAIPKLNEIIVENSINNKASKYIKKIIDENDLTNREIKIVEDVLEN
jgi:hypothetical protein